MNTRWTRWPVIALCLMCVAAATALAAEPNETQLQATGPASPGQPIDGAIEVKGDVDWFFFYTPGQAQVTVTVSNTSADTTGCYYLDVDVYDSQNDRVGGTTNNTVGTQRAFSFVAPKAEKYFIEVTNGSGCDPAGGTQSAYRLDITPANAVTISAPPPPPPPPPVDADRDGVSPPTDCDDTSSSIRPGIPEVVDNDIDENCDGVVSRRSRFASRVSLNRAGARYSGRVVSDAPSGCVGRRVVKLRREGSGTKAFGSTTTNASGRFAIRRASRLRGRVFVVTTAKSFDATVCRFATSRKITG